MADCIEALACPLCGETMTLTDGAVRCSSGHAFDVARQGYVNLLLPGTHAGTADTAEMVAARAAFLGAGHFASLIERTAEAVAEAASGVPGCIVDVGAGTGEYLAAALGRMPGRCGIALDVSKYACRRAARIDGVTAAVGDAWGTLPLQDSSAAVVVSVFAPRNPAEFARVLAPGGALVVLTPNPGHLGSLVAALGLVTVEPGKDERLESQLAPFFRKDVSVRVDDELHLRRTEVTALVGMGPSARHVEPAELAARIGRLTEPVTTAVSVTLGTWRNTRGAR